MKLHRTKQEKDAALKAKREAEKAPKPAPIENYNSIHLSRIIKIAFLIKNNPCMFSRQALSNLFQVHHATIQRDITVLKKMGIEIEKKAKQGYKFVSGYEFLQDTEKPNQKVE